MDMDEEENFLQAREVERGEEYLFNCKWTISIYDRLPIYKNMAPNTKFRLRCYTYWSIYTLFRLHDRFLYANLLEIQYS